MDMSTWEPSKKSNINPLSEKQFGQLQRSIDWSQKQFEFPRKKRLESIRQFVGARYMESGSSKIMPINITKLAIDIYLRQLVARAPRVMFSTKKAEFRPTAANFELAVNQIPGEINLGQTLRKFVMEALFSVGILKVGLSGTEEVLGHSYGEQFVDNVTLDDYFCDMSAKSKELIQYEGNDYWLDYDEVMNAGWIKKSARDGLEPDEYTVVGPGGEERAEGIANTSTAELFKDRIWLRDVWLPAEKLLVTYGVKSKKLFNVVEWEGPEQGPYIWLGFSGVPGNLLPLPPASIWYDINELINALFRKLGNQADAQKTVQAFRGGDSTDAEAFQQASDGDGIRYTGSEPKKLEAGGVNPRTLAFFMQSRELSSYIAGNLDSLGGLAPLTQTVGQDKLLSESAGAQLRDMSARTVDAIKEVFRALAWYEWNDPIKQRTLEKKIPETDISIPIEWNQEAKRGEFSFYDLDIDVYSLQDDSPGLKLQKLGAIVGQYILPLVPLIQQQQGTVDVQAIMRDVARFSDMAEVNEYVTFMDQPVQQSDFGTATPGAPVAPTEGDAGLSVQSHGGSADLMQQLLADSGGSAE